MNEEYAYHLEKGTVERLAMIKRIAFDSKTDQQTVALAMLATALAFIQDEVNLK
jgi:hypothetical protein